MPNRKIYEADWICPIASAPIRNGAFAVENGRISAIGVAHEIAGSDRVRYEECAIIPGFVNAHAHMELDIFRGQLDDLPFMDWIQKLVRIKYQELTPEGLRESARRGAMEMLQAGVTAVAEVMDAGTGWEAMREFGLQGIAYQEVFGPAESAAPEAVKGLAGKIERYRRDETESQRIGVSPHAPYTVSRPLYEAVRDFARRESLPMTAHVAESQAETLFVRDGAGPFADAHAKRGIAVTARNCTPVAYLDSLGLLGPDMLLVHGIEADDRDLDRLRETGTFVVHCPKSNAMLKHGVARVAEMLARGVRVSLGTDSVASNNAIDMFEEMRMAMAQQGSIIRASDAFRMATMEGAEAMGLDKILGSLEIGKRADFAVIDLPTQPVLDPIAAMVASASRADVRAVFIGGALARRERVG